MTFTAGTSQLFAFPEAVAPALPLLGAGLSTTVPSRPVLSRRSGLEEPHVPCGPSSARRRREGCHRAEAISWDGGASSAIPARSPGRSLSPAEDEETARSGRVPSSSLGCRGARVCLSQSRRSRGCGRHSQLAPVTAVGPRQQHPLQPRQGCFSKPSCRNPWALNITSLVPMELFVSSHWEIFLRVFVSLTVALGFFLLRLKAWSFECPNTALQILVVFLKETLKNSFLAIKKTLCRV